MCAILELVSAPLNPIPIADHFRRSHALCKLSMARCNVYFINMKIKKKCLLCGAYHPVCVAYILYNCFR